MKLFIVEDKDSGKKVELHVIEHEYLEGELLPILHKEYWEKGLIKKVGEEEYDSPKIAIDFGMEIAGNYLDDGWELIFSYVNKENKYIAIL